jgi:RNA polymerase sigma factor (TIGR02999 family)
MSSEGEVTRLLGALRAGDRNALEQLIPLVYDELRRIAHLQLRGAGRGRTLDTVALVHEAYLKIAGAAVLEPHDRTHLLAVAARAMRQVIVDFARARSAQKRGGGAHPVTLDEQQVAVEEQAESILDLDRALERLSEHDPRIARIVECRYFAGLSEEETAAVLGVSLRTAQREWKRARAWLREELAEPPIERTGGAQ